MQDSREKIVRIHEDGTKEEMDRGLWICIDERDCHIHFVNADPLDMVRSAIALVETLNRIGLGEYLNEATDMYYRMKRESGADAGL